METAAHFDMTVPPTWGPARTAATAAARAGETGERRADASGSVLQGKEKEVEGFCTNQEQTSAYIDRRRRFSCARQSGWVRGIPFSGPHVAGR
jgi:hypothetical protein